jgi:uncharacterized protein
VKVAFDTNVLVAAVATRGLCADVLRLMLARHELVVGETVMAELARVLASKMRVPQPLIDQFGALLRAEAHIVSAAPPLPLELRDPDDLPVLAEGLAGGADYLVTGDKDLLEVRELRSMAILTPRLLWERLRQP